MELLSIFDEQHRWTGTKKRTAIHQDGDWHETFHLWIYEIDEGIPYLFFQLRSNEKKDYPNQLDITAAGHLLHDEVKEDGVREVEEELGVILKYDELTEFGVFRDVVSRSNFIDCEFAHTYGYRMNLLSATCMLQREEVQGLVRIKFEDCFKLWRLEVDQVYAEGYRMNGQQQKEVIDKWFNHEEFVPHSRSYYEQLIDKLSNAIRVNTNQ